MIQQCWQYTGEKAAWDFASHFLLKIRRKSVTGAQKNNIRALIIF